MGRIYKNMKEALNEIERDIMEMGIRVHPHTMQNKFVKENDDYSTLEVQNYSFTILKMEDKDELVPVLEWSKAEFEERVSKTYENPGEAWKIRQAVWEEFLVDGKFEYTYNDRINRHGQLDNVIQELKENADSRQCIVHINFPEDTLIWRKSRIPCSLSYQFMVRNGKVDVIYNMRSSDFDTHFANDIWLADEIRNYVAEKVGLPTGLYHMNVGSLHRYKNYTKKHVF